MLTADLVRVRVRKGTLTIPELRAVQRQAAVQLAEAYLAVATASLGRTRGAIQEEWQQVPVSARDRRLAAGLLKLIKDRSTFESAGEPDPVALRQAVFQAAAARRRQRCDVDGLDRDAVLRTIAAEHGLAPADLEAAMYSDLKSEQRLVSFDGLSPEALVSAYELAGPQAVLLRALWLRADLYGASPATYRAIFQRLKLHGLLFSLQRLPTGEPDGPAGYRLELDGPYSLFSSVTRYGLKLALVFPLLRQAPSWEMEAKVLWGKQQRPLEFRLRAGRPGRKAAAVAADDAGRAAPSLGGPATRPEVEQLRTRFGALDSGWRVTSADEILELPGVGLCVPDLCFVRASDGRKVYLEVLGFWSRAAVWRRVELVQAGLDYRILFAVSRRLRVSEEVLDPELPGALYVFKGVLSARQVLQRIEQLAD